MTVKKIHIQTKTRTVFRTMMIQIMTVKKIHIQTKTRTVFRTMMI